MDRRKKWLKLSMIGIFSTLFLALLSMAVFQERILDVPYVPTPPEVVEAMLAMAEVSKDDLLYDLGCGDGRIVITAAKMFGSRGIGIDIDPQRIKECREKTRKWEAKRDPSTQVPLDIPPGKIWAVDTGISDFYLRRGGFVGALIYEKGKFFPYFESK
ncbi:MAG: methyltransferase domain-containing protein [Candidatus Aminicenantaceae bacterium]